ncbi:MAG: hypothetical protein Q8J84_08840 [Flavobacteriaceae bacterium]|nr:hypothetical protein [Flavobacteriaceae bacterium]
MDSIKKQVKSLICLQDQQIFQFEHKVGINNIIMFIDSNKYIHNFVPNYQTLIRNNEWPFSDAFIPTYEGFIKRFEETSLSYVAKAISLFGSVQSGKIDYVAFETAVLSEAARGREGKRSKIGLDNQQEILIDELMTLLQAVWTPELGDVEEKANIIVQTVLSGHSSAAELSEKFVEYIEICNEEVTLTNLEATDLKSGGLVKKLLREFCCYSLEKFNKQLKQYRAVYKKLKAKAGIIAAKRQGKIKLTEQIANRIDSIGDNTSRFLQLIKQIDHLNFLNDNIDVKYSFKSWPGLIHWTVFANAMKRTGSTSSITTTGQLLLNF